MRQIRIHDTLAGRPVPLEPREPGKVGIYACGPTVYSRIHVGNARPYVVFMLLKRFLEHEGYEATLVINVTDINDKIYDAARERATPSDMLAREMTGAYFEDTDRLGLGRPDHEPLASETIGPIVDLISALVEGAHAYESGGDVYFRVASFESYGKLSNRRVEDMDQGEEAGTASLKEDPLDFALWKATKEGEDTSWDSPWGPGRPGWHIECSAMAEGLLGVDFAIHGGGSDLIFPHHENEVAQTEAARGAPLARIWMHNGMILTGPEQKMAKSVGNIFQLSEALDRFGREALIDYFLSGHYRQPIAFGEESFEQATARVERVRNFIRISPADDGGGELAPGVRRIRDSFFDALADDFNTPRAMAEVFDLVAGGNRAAAEGGWPSGSIAALREMLPVVGLDSLLAAEEGPDKEANALLAERERARAERDFEAADSIRERLAGMGWEVRDGPEGATLVKR